MKNKIIFKTGFTNSNHNMRLEELCEFCGGEVLEYEDLSNMNEKLEKMKALQEHYNNKIKEVTALIRSRNMSYIENEEFSQKIYQYQMGYNAVLKCVRIMEGLD